MKHEKIDPNKVHIDYNNPRTKPFMHKEKKDISAEDLYQALSDSGKFVQLETSIISNKGITHPIIVNKESNGNLVAIEGNTRLKIYQEQKEKHPEKPEWKEIPCLVHENLSKDQIEAIRLQSHMIGIRPWTPYATAIHLYNLRKAGYHEDKLIDFCGGSKTRVVKYIKGYQKMRDLYIKRLEATEEPKITFYSFFEIIQNPKLQTALSESSFTENDYSDWIIEEHKGNNKLNGSLYTRQNLPRVLKDKYARQIFIEQNLEKATNSLGHTKEDEALAKAKIETIINTLFEKWHNLTAPQLTKKSEDQDYIELLELLERELKNHQDFINTGNKTKKE